MADDTPVPPRPQGAGERRDRALSDAENAALGKPTTPPPPPLPPEPKTMTLGEAFGKAKKALGFKKGGAVPGKGSGDKVPAMLEPGEYVLPKDTTKAVGKKNLDHLKESTHNPANRQGVSHAPGARGFGAASAPPVIGRPTNLNMGAPANPRRK